MSSCAKGDNLVMAKQNNQNGGQQCHKKQVRRRLHTSHPYQERLLNMAEARKEIVTALKFHRASMKQANECKQPPPQPQLLSKSMVSQHTQYRYKELIVGVQNHESCKSRNEISSLSTTLPNNTSQNSVSSSSNNNISNHAPNSHTSSLIESPTIYRTLDIALPPLGLNLNLQAITNLYTPINTSTSSPSPPLWIPTNPTSTVTPGGDQVGPTSGSNGVDQVHHGKDEDEMAKIRSIGEQHQMEWDDTLDLVKSTWWFKFLKSLEFGKEMKGVEKNYHDNNYECHDPFGEFMEFPAWLSANDDENFLHENLDDYYFSKDYDKDDALPWMDIGDIDGMDDEWLSNLS